MRLWFGLEWPASTRPHRLTFFVKEVISVQEIAFMQVMQHLSLGASTRSAAGRKDHIFERNVVVASHVQAHRRRIAFNVGGVALLVRRDFRKYSFSQWGNNSHFGSP
jgi:hypothetical protein